MKKKILIASPIKQKNKILSQFLLSLEELIIDDLDIYYYFIDDNTDENSTKLLEDFKKRNKNVKLQKSDSLINENEKYICNENEHKWKTSLINRVVLFKNEIIKYAKDKKFNYLFFVDSDILLHPNTINHLVSRNVDIVSNIFWTQWILNNRIEPQVWLQDVNNFYREDWDNPISKEQKRQLDIDFINNLKVPGLYKVGGLGACTLLNEKAINSGVSFSLLDNVSFWGEDRHFCLRARVLGLELYVDTVYPAYHIYREELLKNVDKFKKDGFSYDLVVAKYPKYKSLFNRITKKLISKLKFINTNNFKIMIKNIIKNYYSKKRVISNNNKIVLSMIVKNEENNYLSDVLKDAIEYVDEVLIIDDASTDNTVELCEKILKNKPHKIIKNKVSMFNEEYKLRSKQWEETIKLKPNWILFLDADDIFENRMKESIKYLVQNPDIDLYCFRYYDMWNETHYRSDKYWQGHLNYRPMLLRYQPFLKNKYNKLNQHCGTLPKNIWLLNKCNSDIRCKHMGWSREEDRIRKYKRYMKLDGDGKFGNLNQYKSIIDKNPNLIRFEDEN